MLFRGPPKIKRHHLGDQGRMSSVVKWMLKNDEKLSSILFHPFATLLYGRGFRPKTGTDTDPEEHFGPIRDFTTWVSLKALILHDKFLRNASRKEWNELLRIFMEQIDESKKDMEKACRENGITPEEMISTEVIIPKPQHIFALDNYALSGEFRIHGFFYLRIFGEQFRI